MKKFLLKSGACISALMLLLLVTQWVRSYWRGECFEYFWSVRSHTVYPGVVCVSDPNSMTSLAPLEPASGR